MSTDDKVTQLKAVGPEREVCPLIVEYLETLLEAAKQGRVNYIAAASDIVAEDNNIDGMFQTRWLSSDNVAEKASTLRLLTLSGMVSSLAFEINASITRIPAPADFEE